MAGLVSYAIKLTTAPELVTERDLDALRAVELGDRGIVDANQIASYFNYVNRVADGLGVELESTWPEAAREPRRYALGSSRRFPEIAESAVPVLDVEQSREMDRLMIDELGVPLERMMENAGRSVAAVCRARLGGSVSGAGIAVAAGRGGNGGGALVAARHLANAGAVVTVTLSEAPERLSQTAHGQWRLAEAMGVTTRASIGAADLVVDGVLGYGLDGPPRPEAASLLHEISEISAPEVVAVDVPSGLEVGSGTLHRSRVVATATVALAAPKRGTLERAHRAAVGEVYVADISVPPIVFERIGARLQAGIFGSGGVVRLRRES